MPMTFLFPINAILLLGPTGVGKSPLGGAIALYGLFGRKCHHLDFGSELRSALSAGEGSADYSAEELDFIHGVLERGLLLENERFPLATKIIGLFLKRASFRQHDLLILNGIPRHAGQAQDMAGLITVHALIVLDCSADDVFCRIRENVGRDRAERIDDNRELVEKKLSIFRERTAPLVDHYAHQGSAVYRIGVSGTMTTDRTYQELRTLAAADPPVALVAEPPER
jgi:adenylate kinase family enzyme